ncbi:GtrA family protein [Microlunatus sp. Gsoil 973]|uniref:GtrA family protein n=1 Tax=Microlunatus sp. Gsoil 973 TaxID=2672569 RepID=UPI0018A840D8|nr:GtrA family protein [Microlunatus sp. Gsoil 973]
MLPRLLKWIPETAIGFAMIGLTGFFIDIGVLTLLHGALDLPYALAVTLGYGTASVANFFLNRWLNFQMHGNIAKQSGRQAVVAISNYVIWILGFSTVLETIGVQYQVSRIISACVEGIYLYVMMRIWVFPAREQLELVAREGRPALEPAEDDRLAS